MIDTAPVMAHIWISSRYSLGCLIANKPVIGGMKGRAMLSTYNKDYIFAPMKTAITNDMLIDET